MLMCVVFCEYLVRSGRKNKQAKNKRILPQYLTRKGRKMRFLAKNSPVGFGLDSSTTLLVECRMFICLFIRILEPLHVNIVHMASFLIGQVV